MERCESIAWMSAWVERTPTASGLDALGAVASRVRATWRANIGIGGPFPTLTGFRSGRRSGSKGLISGGCDIRPTTPRLRRATYHASPGVTTLQRTDGVGALLRDRLAGAPALRWVAMLVVVRRVSLRVPRSSARSPWPALALVLAIAGWSSALGCDRNLEPFDPSEEPRQPDLARIFPEGEQQGPGLRAPASPDQSAPAQRGRRGAAPVVSDASSGTRSGSGSPIRGRIELSPDLASDAAPGSILFLIARSGSASGGPPLAVQRYASPRFPLEFEIGPEQVMIPTMRFEGDIRLTARLDSDGNAMTRTPGDLQGALPMPLSPGAEGAVLTLDQKL